LVRVLKSLGPKGLPVLGVSKTSRFRVFEHVQNRRTVGFGYQKPPIQRTAGSGCLKDQPGFMKEPKKNRKEPAVLEDI
jgi:hypothetical protein